MITLIDAPGALGLKRPAPERLPGTREAPRVLREFGLLARLGARDGGRVEPPPYTGERDAQTRVLNGTAVGDYARRLADAIGPLLARGDFPLVLGGDCSILLGSALALRRRGRYGLLFLDGHRDLLTPERSSAGAAAGMDLALVTGHGPAALVSLGGDPPMVAPEDVIVFGFRDEDRWYDADLVERARDAMRAVRLDDARAEGLAYALGSRLVPLLGGGAEGFWIHLDVDVLDDTAMFAVDSREPGGMRLDELAEVLDQALGTDRCVGMHVTIYDPERDPTRACARGLVDTLVRGLARVARRG